MSKLYYVADTYNNNATITNGSDYETTLKTCNQFNIYNQQIFGDNNRFKIVDKFIKLVNMELKNMENYYTELMKPIKLTKKNILDIDKIVSDSNNKENFKESCFFIVSQLEKMFPNFDKRELAIDYIELNYFIELVF